MKQIIILILVFIYQLNAYEFKLNKNDIKYISESKKKSFIINRINKYQTLKKKVIDFSLIRKLSHVNSFLNKIRPKKDISSKLLLDHWATPKEFLLKGYGDCEDYVITKYFTLIELGIKKENLYFAVVDIIGRASSHMVLLYLNNKNNTPLVLDNLSYKVVPLTYRKKLIPKFAFNEIDSYHFTHKKFIKKIKINWGEENKWNNLLKRVYSKNE